MSDDRRPDANATSSDSGSAAKRGATGDLPAPLTKEQEDAVRGGVGRRLGDDDPNRLSSN